MISTGCVSLSFSLPLSLSICNTVGVYLPQASQPDELTIDEQEMLEVIEDGDMEDWVKVQVQFSRVMYVFMLPLRLHFIVSVCLCFFFYSRLAIRQEKWAMSQKNTCSSRPPTVC